MNPLTWAIMMVKEIHKHRWDAEEAIGHVEFERCSKCPKTRIRIR